MIYQFKDGYRVGQLDAQAVGDRLEQLRKSNGGKIYPQAVVDDARPANSPTHEAFEWDDKKAATEHRLSQARLLVRSVVIVQEEESPPVRAFVNVHYSGDEENSYTSIAVAMSDPDLRSQVLSQAMAELKAFQQKYKDLEEFAGIFSAIDEVEVAA